MNAPTAPRFERGRHLWLAIVGLIHPWLEMRVETILPWFVVTFPWTAEVDVLDRLIPTCFAAMLAWLAFQRLDTHADVTVFPRRWSTVGALVLVVFSAELAVLLTSLANEGHASIAARHQRWLYAYLDWDGDLLLGWVLVACLVSAIGEELIYRGLLLRALEGYVGPWPALVTQAVVFELVHVFVYDRGFHGGEWFLAGLIYGYAFQRTRSIAVPVVMHAVWNAIFFVTLHALARA